MQLARSSSERNFTHTRDLWMQIDRASTGYVRTNKLQLLLHLFKHLSTYSKQAQPLYARNADQC